MGMLGSSVESLRSGLSTADDGWSVVDSADETGYTGSNWENSVDLDAAANDFNSDLADNFDSVLAHNKAKGIAFEKSEFAKFKENYSYAEEQVTIVTASGVKTRVDARKCGNLRIQIVSDSSNDKESEKSVPRNF